MIFLVSIFSLAHIVFLLVLTLKWRKIKKDDINHLKPTFSVVVPVRNEATNIVYLLKDLTKQTYPRDSFEIIIVDDFSSDQTVQVVLDYIQGSSLDIIFFSLKNPSEQGKKYALTKAIAHAKYDIILTTDADCRVGARWIQVFSEAFTKDKQIVAGPVSLNGKGLFSSLQKTEFAGLVGFGAVTLTENNPSMCSGANLAFRKAAFQDVGGYQDNIHIPTGDDEFLLFDVLKKYPKTGLFLKNEDAIVTTQTHQTLKALFNQRSRWIGKWKYNKNWKLRLLAILFFFDYLFLTVLIVSSFVFHPSLWFLFSILLLRFLSDYLFLRSTGSFLKIGNVGLAAFLLQIFYPPHVFFMGLVSIFGGYTWKGRRY